MSNRLALIGLSFGVALIVVAEIGERLNRDVPVIREAGNKVLADWRAVTTQYGELAGSSQTEKFVDTLLRTSTVNDNDRDVTRKILTDAKGTEAPLEPAWKLGEQSYQGGMVNLTQAVFKATQAAEGDLTVRNSDAFHVGLDLWDGRAVAAAAAVDQFNVDLAAFQRVEQGRFKRQIAALLFPNSDVWELFTQNGSLLPYRNEVGGAKDADD